MFLLLIAVIGLMPVSHSKEVAITFDDAPRKADGYFTGPQRAQKLVEVLKEREVSQVAFFANSARLNPEGVERLKTYGEAGHIIANHTHSHPDFNRMSLSAYIEDFLLADSALNQFKGFAKMFRFPYLREGNSDFKRDGMRDALKSHGYQNAYVTLNNYDWHIERLFQQAIQDNSDISFGRMSQFYVNVMMESIEYYEEIAQTHLGRSPKHILLLHEMDISALFVGDLIDELRGKGWEIISPEDAYTDELADHQSKRLFKYNPGRIGEIARIKGQKKGLWHHTLNEAYLDKRFADEVIADKLVRAKETK